MNDAAQAQTVFRLIQSGNRESAVEAIRKLTEVNAKLADQWLRISQAALSLGELSLASSCARRFLSVNRKQPQRALVTAGILAEAGRFDQALKTIRPFLKKDPHDPSINHLCGTIYQQLGETHLASKHLRATLRAANLAGPTWLTLAAQHRFTEDDPLLRQLLELEEPMAASEDPNRLQYQYALGKALLDVEEYDRAFDAFLRGAALAPAAGQYDPERESRRIDAVLAENDVSAVAAACGPEHDDGRAIFVIAPPRSGTTLLQRILTAHKAVTGGGEFSSMGVAAMDLRRRALDSCARLSASADAGKAELGIVAKVYSHLLSERFGSRGTIVDKSINNTNYVGLIANAFPQAPIIVIERDIHDVAWSCFRTCFSKGMTWSWSLANIATHLRAERRLISHWQDTLADRITLVSYEKLVSEPDEELPRILKGCNLEPDANIINFHEGKIPVTTSSVVQVNKPLSTKAIGTSENVRHRMQEFSDAFSR